MKRALLLVPLLAYGVAHADPQPVASAAGLALGVAAMHSGAGEHPLAPMGGAWGRIALGSACYLEGELGGSLRSDGGTLAAFDQRSLRGVVGLGCSAGTRATRVAASIGPAISLRSTSIDAQKEWRATSMQPGLRYRAGFLIPIRDHLQVDVLMGGGTHGWVFDHDLLIQGGVRW